MLKKATVFSLLLAASVFAQRNATPVNQVAGPPPYAIQCIYDYAGGTVLAYIGCASSVQTRPTTITVSAATNASPVSFTATAHGFDFQGSTATTSPSVCISGATGGWVGINGCWVATITGANTLTIPVDSTAFGAFAGQTITFTTLAPLTSQAVWSVQKIVYDATNRPIWSGFASLPGGAGSTTQVSGSTAMQFIWANRTSLAYN